MYIPSTFRIDSEPQLSSFVRTYSFATLVTYDGQQSHASHLPMLLDGAATSGGKLLFHMARANPQWQHLNGDDEVLAIFTGPHTYISPSLYAPGNNVPTWNYTAVHVYGRPRVIEQADELQHMLSALVQHYESTRALPWVDSNDNDYRQKLIQAIIGVELTISRVEGKFKLSQNRPDDIESVIAGLSQSDSLDDRQVAEFMNAQLLRKQ